MIAPIGTYRNVPPYTGSPPPPPEAAATFLVGSAAGADAVPLEAADLGAAVPVAGVFVPSDRAGAAAAAGAAAGAAEVVSSSEEQAVINKMLKIPIKGKSFKYFTRHLQSESR